MRHIILLCAFLLCLTAARAQYVAIPDSNLGIWLYGYMGGQCVIGNSQTGWQMDTSDNVGCKSYWLSTGYAHNISITNQNISNTDGLQYFLGGGTINLSGNKLTSVPYFVLDNSYSQINLDNNLIDTLNLNQLTQHSTIKTYFNCNGNKIHTVIPDTGFIDMPNFYKLGLNDNLIDTLPLIKGVIWYGYVELQIDARHNHLHGDFDGSYCFLLDVGNNQLTSLTYSHGCAGVVCDSNQISILRYGYIIGTSPNYSANMNCSHNNMTGISLDNFQFYNVNCSYNHITYMTNTYSVFNCSHNNLTSLRNFGPIYNGSYCKSVDCSYNPLLTCLPMLPASLSFYLNAIGTGITCVPNRFSFCNYTGPTSANAYPLCALTSSTCPSYISLQGQVYNDSIANCIIDTNEARVHSYPVSLYKNGLFSQKVFTFNNGFYGMGVDTGTYYLQTDSQYTDVFNIRCPANDTFMLQLHSTATSVPNLNFGLDCALGFDLVAWSGEAGDRIRPGDYGIVSFDAGDLAKEYGVACAHGVSGSVVIIKHSPYCHFVAPTSSVHPYVISGDTLTWTVADFGTVNNQTDFNSWIKVDSQVTVGNYICFDFYIYPILGDKDTTNNKLSSCFTVVNSFDPNYKTVYPPDTLTTNPTWLTYTIHFQNTGTDTAFNVYLLDTMDTRYVDISSFQFLESSHHCFAQALSTGVLRFDFPSINLLDSLHNEPASHGWLQYKIKTKPSLLNRVQIKNTASIYFDFNSAVTTNTTLNTVYICNDTSIFSAQSICEGDTVSFYGKRLFATGVYRDTFITQLGCDSMFVFTLTVRPIARDTVTLNICQDDSVVFANKIYKSSGLYSDTLTGINLCDSVTFLNLKVWHSMTTTHSIICFGDSVTFGNNKYKIAGVYSDTLIGRFGCDSFSTLFLSVTPFSRDTFAMSICTGSGVALGSHTYTTSGIFMDTILAGSVNSCDSITVLVLSVIPPNIHSVTQYICIGDSVLFGTHILNTTGTYQDTLLGVNACDSISVLHLTVLQLITDTIYQNICEGDSVPLGTHFLSTTGIYHDTLQSVYSCDSFIVLNLVVKPIAHHSISTSICQGDSMLIGNQYYHTAVTHSDTLVAVNTCDSIVTTILSVVPYALLTQQLNACIHESVTVNGHIYDTSGIYIDTVKGGSVTGCNLILTTDLAVLPLSISTQSAVICSGSGTSIGSHIYTTAGTHIDTIVGGNFAGCDSIIILHLTVNPKPNPIITEHQQSHSDTLTTGIYAHYYWISDSASTNGDTTNSIVVRYLEYPRVRVLVIDSNGCSDTSAVVWVNYWEGITTIEDTHPLHLYPNPNTGSFTLQSDGLIHQSYTIYNLLGQAIASDIITTNKQLITLPDVQEGFYILNVTGNPRPIRFTIVK